MFIKISPHATRKGFDGEPPDGKCVGTTRTRGTRFLGSQEPQFAEGPFSYNLLKSEKGVSGVDSKSQDEKKKLDCYLVQFASPEIISFHQVANMFSY